MVGPTPIADGLWEIQRETRLPGGLRLPTRATIVRLPDGGLLVHGPTRLEPGVADAVEALGPVRHLVAGNRFHHLGLSDWVERFPRALLWGAPGLAPKRKDLKFEGSLDAGTAPPWADTLRPLPLAGMPPMSEVLFLHPATGSVLCTDLIFNVRRPANTMTKLVLILMGTKGRFRGSRLLWRYTKDRRALAASLSPVFDWTFGRVVPGHGEVFEAEGGDARPAVRDALAWVLRP